MVTRGVSVDLQADGRVFVQPYTRAENGPEIVDGLPDVVASVEDAEVLGRQVIASLKRSFSRVLPAINLRTESPADPMLKWLGLKSYGAYMKGVREVSVSCDFDDDIEGTVRLGPLHNPGPRGGFVGIEGADFTIEYDNPTQLGEAIQHALTLAT